MESRREGGMQRDISSRRGGWHLLVVVGALFGLLLVPCERVRRDAPGLTLFVFDPIGAEVVGSTGSLQAVRDAAGAKRSWWPRRPRRFARSSGESPGRIFPERELVAETRYLTPGTCTFVASLPQTAEHEAVEVTSSVLVAAVTFNSKPPRPAVRWRLLRSGGELDAECSRAARREGGACTFTKPRLEQSLPAAPHSERASRPPACPRDGLLPQAREVHDHRGRREPFRTRLAVVHRGEGST